MKKVEWVGVGRIGAGEGGSGLGIGPVLGFMSSLPPTVGHEEDHEDQYIVMGWGGVGRAFECVAALVVRRPMLGDRLRRAHCLGALAGLDRRDGPKAGLISGWVQCVCVCWEGKGWTTTQDHRGGRDV